MPACAPLPTFAAYLSPHLYHCSARSNRQLLHLRQHGSRQCELQVGGEDQLTLLEKLSMRAAATARSIRRGGIRKALDDLAAGRVDRFHHRAAFGRNPSDPDQHAFIGRIFRPGARAVAGGPRCAQNCSHGTISLRKRKDRGGVSHPCLAGPANDGERCADVAIAASNLRIVEDMPVPANRQFCTPRPPAMSITAATTCSVIIGSSQATNYAGNYPAGEQSYRIRC